jgi:hypothetical protein
LKKEAKNFCSFGLSPSGKAEAKTEKSFLLLLFKKEDVTPKHPCSPGQRGDQGFGRGG